MGKFIAKLDLKKAFDNINKSFLLHILERKGFPLIFIKLILTCISDVPLCIPLNNKVKGYFFHFINGLQQGCPLSLIHYSINLNSFSCILDREINYFIYNTICYGHYQIFQFLFVDILIVTGVLNLTTTKSLKITSKNFKNFMELEHIQSKS